MVAEVIVDEGTEHLSTELGIGVIWRRTMRKRSCELSEGELDFGDTKPAAQTLSSGHLCIEQPLVCSVHKIAHE